MRCTLSVPALLTLGIVVACSSDRATGIDGICDITNPVSAITLAPSTATLFFRSPPRTSDALQLEPTAYGRFGAARTDVPFTFHSSNSAVASVDGTGLVTAADLGTATITVSGCDEDASMSVTVVSELDSIDVTAPEDTLVVGDSMLVTARALAVGGGVIDGALFDWTVDPESVAGIAVVDDSTVMVSALTEGTAVVSAAIGATTGSATVVVIAAPPPP